MNRNKRLVKLREVMIRMDLEAVIITSYENIFYFSGFSGSNGCLIVTKDEKYLITDFRYTLQCKAESQDWQPLITDISYTFETAVKETLQGFNRIGIENKNILLSHYRILNMALPGLEGGFIDLDDELTMIRSIKDKEEIGYIEEAANIGDRAFEHILGFIKPGITERQLAFELEFYMKSLGATAMSFDPIVVSGVRSSMPHGKPTDKALEYGDFLTMDFGCIVKAYCSDMTRTVIVGKGNERQKSIYNTVLKAQKAALNEIKPGVFSHDVDMVARNIIKLEGYENYFGHGLGHGVGIEIHELPRLNQKKEDSLELVEGMVLTDEPGIYIPDFGGVRIEDLVVVTHDGNRVVSNSTKELLEIN